ncbi:MAG: zinc ribbon domain-containing protein [Candidatus Zixiibacteriota bacterium]|nr:MAG: zinc ribbon domain-containing protein [candidate division Zixibacteria bacterium]
MKCPNCKGDIAGDYKGKTCPSCGEPLDLKRSLLYEWSQRVAGFTHDRGFLFWLLTFVVLLLFLAVLENLLGKGILGQTLDQHKFVATLMILYIAAHLQLVRNINTEIRPGYPGPYWVDRLIIRKFRRGTNRSLAAGFLTAVVVVGPLNFLELMPAYALIMSLFTAAFWSIQAFRVDDREFLDAKVQTYFHYLGVKRLREWRKASGAYLIAIVVAAGVFYGLMHVPGLWWMIKSNPTLNEILELFHGLFSWVPQLWPQK